MGTNYYVIPKRCDKCGRHDEPIHLGKSSMGWSFGLQANDWQYYKNWQEMQAWLQDKEIENEYGESCTPQDFIAMVERKKDTEDPEPVEYKTVVIDGYKFHTYTFS